MKVVLVKVLEEMSGAGRQQDEVYQTPVGNSFRPDTKTEGTQPEFMLKW